MEYFKTFEQFINESYKNNDLKRGSKITIDSDDEDGDFKAGDYTVIGLPKGGVELKGMGHNKIRITLGALKSAGYTIDESKVNESVDDLKDKYQSLVRELEKAKVPCKVKLSKDKITVELGFNYPDSLADKAFDACNAANIDDSKCDICAEESGGHVIDSKRIMGGPRRH